MAADDDDTALSYSPPNPSAGKEISGSHIPGVSIRFITNIYIATHIERERGGEGGWKSAVEFADCSKPTLVYKYVFITVKAVNFHADSYYLHCCNNNYVLIQR